MNQRKYALDLIKEMGSSGAKSREVPLDLSKKVVLEENNELMEELGRFQRLVGRLIYLTMIRPNMSYAAQFLSQCMSAPRHSHKEVRRSESSQIFETNLVCKLLN